MIKLVFPKKLLSILRTIAMKQDELYQVSTLLELVGSGGSGKHLTQKLELQFGKLAGILGFAVAC